MVDNLITRTRRAWNVFLGRDNKLPDNEGGGRSGRPDRTRFSFGTEKSIVMPLYTRIGVDSASVRINHVRVDKNGVFQEIIYSGLNNCLTIEANIDQTATAFIQDAVMSLCDEGVIGIVPVDTTSNPYDGTYDIHTMRIGKILEWFPSSVRIKLYNDRIGQYEEIIVSKTFLAVVENPFYSVMNEPTSTLRRLVEKMLLLDTLDRKLGGKLDLIIQLPFVVRSDLRTEQAEKRRLAIQRQLEDSEYGIAYTDATEKITQLNRPVENNLQAQVEYLTKMLYNQLGISEAILTGTASDSEIMNYHTRTIEPMIGAIVGGMNRVFLSKTARSQGQTIMPFKAAFKYIPTSLLPDIADKFTRNEILTANEVRSLIGYYPSDDPGAAELRNKNLNKPGVQNGSEEVL